MADHFENAKDEILLRTEGNGGPSNRDMLKAMGALAKDVDEALEQLDKKQKERHDQTVNALKAHARDEEQRVAAIALKVASKMHDPLHKEHLEKDHKIVNGRSMDDPEDSQFLEHRESAFPTGDKKTLFEIMLAWGVVKWAVAGAAMLLLAAGISYWTSSCAAHKAEAEAIERGIEMHFVEPSPSP